MQSIIKYQCTKLEAAVLSVAVFTGLAGLTFLLKKKFGKGRIIHPSRKIDIEIRYDAERDADATLLAQNQVRIIRMVLTPLERQILREKAQLIYVFGGDYWEMRLKNASDSLKTSIRELLEAKEW